MPDENRDIDVSPAETPKVGASPLHRVSNVQRPASPEPAREQVGPGAAENQRYAIRFSMSPLGWLALVEHSDTGGTTALGDVLDLGAEGCLMMAYAVPPGMLQEHRDVSVSLRVSRENVVNCMARVESWTQMDNGVQLRLTFLASDPLLRKQLDDIATSARARLLQLSSGDE